MKKILFLLLSFLFFIVAFFVAKPINTELTGAFLNTNSPLIKLSKVSASYLNVILESDSEDGIEDLKSFLPSQNKLDYAAIFDVYRNYPENFLTVSTRKKLIAKEYKKLDEESLARIYNPLGFYITPPDSDPYLFATEYVSSLINHNQQNIQYEGKFYSILRFKINGNDEIKTFIQAQKNVQEENVGNIYLTGAPIHSYKTSQKSTLEINIICLVSIFALTLLCKFYFKSLKILVPITGSIVFGFLFGYSASVLIFKELHILTFVFSTSLIGISLDYSLHYFLSGKEKWFRKDLTASMVTTVIAFFVLLLSDMIVLKQIAIFTAFGLLGVYLFVLNVLNNKLVFESRILPTVDWDSFKVPIIIFLGIVVTVGFFKLKFNDDIRSLYIPPKSLLKSERLYKTLFMSQPQEFLIIKGKNVDEILRKEEAFGTENSISLSNFVASKELQEENLKLVKNLYSENLSQYANFLSKERIKKIEQKEFKIYDVEKFPLNSEFMLDKNTSYIMLNKHHEGAISPAEEVTKQLNLERKKCIKLFPILFGLLIAFLALVFGFKNALRIIISPIGGILFALGLISMLGQEINLFHIIALFLVIGFSLDYSIFRLNGQEKSKNAVFISALSTIFSFLMLSFTSFKVISSLGLTLFAGIAASYLLSLILINSKSEII